MRWIADALRDNPELALFLTLALGALLGRLRLGGFELGSVVGSLLAGVLVGQLGIPVSGTLKNAFFLLFLFATGSRTGPLFFRGLKATALPQTVLTLLLCFTALGAAYAAARLFAFDAGAAGGLLAGAMTSSATLGTAGDTLVRLAGSETAAQAMLTSRTVAFAVTYLLGMVLAIWLLSRLGPRLLRVNLAAECRRLEEEMGVKREEVGAASLYSAVGVRGYEIPGPLAGLSVQELEARFESRWVFVERVRRDGAIVEEPDPSLQLRAGDRVALSGRQERLLGGDNPLRDHEVDDRELLDIPSVEVEVVLTRRDRAGRTLAELAQETGARSVYVKRLTRAGLELPFTPGMPVERGDVLCLVGSRRNVARVADQIGYPEWPGEHTDLASVAIAILLGGLIGLPALVLGRVTLTLSMFVGVLLAGLVFGWLRSVHRRFGPIPGPALWLLENLGLTAFLALVGIGAGPDFVKGLVQSGPSLIAAGLLVTVVPHLVTILAGHHIFRLNVGVLLGVCCGAGTCAAALAAVQQEADSKVPALGYGMGCALGNTILALWGSVIVMLIGV